MALDDLMDPVADLGRLGIHVDQPARPYQIARTNRCLRAMDTMLPDSTKGHAAMIVIGNLLFNVAHYATWESAQARDDAVRGLALNVIQTLRMHDASR